MPPNPGTCTPWATEADVADCSPCADLDPGDVEPWLQIASDVLYNLTRRRYSGQCTDVVRPPGDCQCGSWCCGYASRVTLPGFPVVDITEVTIEGVVVPAANYRVDNWRWLVWQNYEGDTGTRRAWPCCQHLGRPLGELGTWSVEYTFGQMPPPGGIAAAAGLACQYALACSSDPGLAGQCLLPQRAVQVVRQGVSIGLSQSLAAELQTGYRLADDWVSSDNTGAYSYSGVFVPGQRRTYRTTSPSA